MLNSMGAQAKAAARVLALADGKTRAQALNAMADALLDHQGAILAANAQDVLAGEQSGLTRALIDRLTLTPARVAGMADGLRSVAGLPDPVGVVLDEIIPDIVPLEDILKVFTDPYYRSRGKVLIRMPGAQE